MLKELVVGFPIRETPGGIEVLLGFRKRPPWQGCASGFGGHVEGYHIDKNPEEAQSRETYEECGLIVLPDMLEKRAMFDIFRDGKDPQKLHVYLIHSFFGTPIETAEMKPIWVPIEKLPRKIVPGDDQWLHPVLCGSYAAGTMWRSSDAEQIFNVNVFFSQKGIMSADEMNTNLYYRDH